MGRVGFLQILKRSEANRGVFPQEGAAYLSVWGAVFYSKPITPFASASCSQWAISASNISGSEGEYQFGPGGPVLKVASDA